MVGYGYNDARRLAYIDSDGALHSLTLIDGQPWEYAALTEEASCPAAAGQGLAGYTFDSGQGLMHRIVYLDLDGNVQSLHQLLGWSTARQAQFAPAAKVALPLGELVPVA